MPTHSGKKYADDNCVADFKSRVLEAMKTAGKHAKKQEKEPPKYNRNQIESGEGGFLWPEE